MRVALVHDWLTGMRGGEKCLEVLCRMYPHAELHTLLRVPGKLSPPIERMRLRTSFLQHLPGVAHYYRWLLPVMPLAVERLRLRAYDLVVSLSHAVAKAVMPPPGAPHICYCFTPMRYIWDLQHDYQPRPNLALGRLGRVRSDLVRFAAEAAADLLRRWDRATADRVTHFVAISRTVQDRIARCYARDSVVIYPPVNTAFYRPALVPRDDYYLCVSAFSPYKRIDLAIEACRLLGRRLVIIGTGPEERRLRALASKLDGKGRGVVSFLGWQPDEVLRDHYRRCRALLFPGQEDFGIVPVEAQACGCPVIAFARGGATETVIPANRDQPPTGVLFNPQTADSLAGAVLELERQAGDFSPDAAHRQADRFRTERFRAELSAYVRHVRSHWSPGRSAPAGRTWRPLVQHARAAAS